MSSLEDAYVGDSRWRAALTTALVFAAGVAAAVGLAAATASLIAGFGVRTTVALKLAASLAGLALPVAFFALPTGSGRRGRVVAGVGGALVVSGLALFWTSIPAGWHGDPTALPPVAVATYALGLVALLRSDLSSQQSTEQPSVVVSATEHDAGNAGSTRAVGADGGTEDDDLRFFDRDDR